MKGQGNHGNVSKWPTSPGGGKILTKSQAPPSQRSVASREELIFLEESWSLSECSPFRFSSSSSVTLLLLHACGRFRDLHNLLFDFFLFLSSCKLLFVLHFRLHLLPLCLLARFFCKLITLPYHVRVCVALFGLLFRCVSIRWGFSVRNWLYLIVFLKKTSGPTRDKRG